MIANQQIDLDLIPGGINPIVNVNQFDKQSNAVTFFLYKGDSEFTIPNNASVDVNGTKPDGHGFTYACSVANDRKSVDMNVTTQMTAVYGDTLCELRIKTSTEIIGTRNFILRVEKAGLADDSVISDSDLPVIAHAAEVAAELDAYIQTATDAADSAQNAVSQVSAYNTQAQNAATSAQAANANVQTIYGSIETAKANANTAASNANAAASVINNLTATATTLAPGSQATASYNNGVLTLGIPQGAQGASGSYVAIAGMFAMRVDNAGNLYAIVNDSELTSDNFRYDPVTGNLYYVIPEEEENDG